MKSKVLIVSLLMMNFLFCEDTSWQNASNNDRSPTFINPSSRRSTESHETRQQKLDEGIGITQQKILAQVIWHVDPNKPIQKVEIHITEQKLYAYQNDQAVGISPVCTARVGYVTPLGSYKIIDMKEVYFSNQYGEFADAKGNIVGYSASLGDTPPPGAHYVPSPMPHFMRLTDEGVGMHEGWLPGFPASHGCIRLPASVAADLFRQVSIGTPVTIVQ